MVTYTELSGGMTTPHIIGQAYSVPLKVVIPVYTGRLHIWILFVIYYII